MIHFIFHCSDPEVTNSAYFLDSILRLEGRKLNKNKKVLIKFSPQKKKDENLKDPQILNLLLLSFLFKN